ncbi:hypothetical protein IE53DRAFT_262845 [Violaceomyces palustris]|uniref:Uncharacterized protein n=1 Tax=Violaceomyces palustris TaxID=1673888 RepID=A0ACD0NN04_9BASI|nr:hypothetical protein IE53DRAFT_262845 [Violaceomyces palustris]
MQFLGSSIVFAAILASTTLVSASSHDRVHAPAIRRLDHHRRSTCSSSATGKGHHRKHHKNKKHGKSGSSASSTSSSSKPKSTSSSSNSSSGSSSGSSGSSSSSGSSNSNSGSGSSSSSSSSLSKSSGKPGLCWANSNGIPIDNFLIGDVSWYYSWSDTPGWDNAPVDDVMYCPMLWGYKNEASFKKNVLNNPNGKFNKHKCVMGMNEVNQVGQAKMSPAEGCQLMRENISPLKAQGWYVMGPSTTSAPDGKDWYDEFKKTCPDVFNSLDAIALHWYDVDLDKFKAYVEDWHDTYGKDVWVTEFACQNFNGGAQCSSGEAWNLLQGATQWMDTKEWVKGYAPFAVLDNLQGVSEVNRLSNGHQPTALFNMFSKM